MRRHVLNFTSPFFVSPLTNSTEYNAQNLLTADDKRKVSDCLCGLGIDPNSQIALIHVRDSSHDLALHPHVSYDQDCVNADSQNYQRAVDHLLAQDFSVITVGNHKSSISKLRGVVNYHQSPLRTPLLDFLLASRATIYIGTAAGAPSGAAMHFRVPCLLTDYFFPGSSHTLEQLTYAYAVVLMKNIYLDGNALTQSVIAKFGLPTSDVLLQERRIVLANSSESEILEGLREVLSLGLSREKWDAFRQSPLQKTFWEIFDANTRIPRIFGHPQSAVISPNFLKLSPHWLE